MAAQQPVLRSALEIVQERAEETRLALRLLHDEVVAYLDARDLSVEDLPAASPLRAAIEAARDRI